MAPVDGEMRTFRWFKCLKIKGGKRKNMEEEETFHVKKLTLQFKDVQPVECGFNQCWLEVKSNNWLSIGINWRTLINTLVIGTSRQLGFLFLYPSKMHLNRHPAVTVLVFLKQILQNSIQFLSLTDSRFPLWAWASGMICVMIMLFW